MALQNFYIGLKFSLVEVKIYLILLLSFEHLELRLINPPPRILDLPIMLSLLLPQHRPEPGKLPLQALVPPYHTLQFLDPVAQFFILFTHVLIFFTERLGLVELQLQFVGDFCVVLGLGFELLEAGFVFLF